MIQMRKDKEGQKFSEKQETRQKMIDRQAEQLRSIKNKENEILEKQVAEAEQKAAQLIEEKERRRYEMKQAIEQSRHHQIAKKVAAKEQSQQEEKEFSEFWKIRNEELELARQQEVEEERLRCEELKGYLHKQMEDKQRKIEEQFRLELQAQAKAQALLDHNEKQFYSYAEECVKGWHESGKNVKPLILELKNYKKRLVV